MIELIDIIVYNNLISDLNFTELKVINTCTRKVYVFGIYILIFLKYKYSIIIFLHLLSFLSNKTCCKQLLP